MKKGFTLIELLIVLAIIGILGAVILSSFFAARAAGRDARRIADLRQVQIALQLFYLKCGFYPGKYLSGGCFGGLGDVSSDNSFQDSNPNAWKTLEDDLRNAEIGVSSIPYDPLYVTRNYSYHVQLKNSSNTTPRGQCYILEAHLETDHRILTTKDDLDDLNIIHNLLPSVFLCGSGSGNDLGICKNLYPPNVNCDDGASGNYPRGYCVGNSECFHE